MVVDEAVRRLEVLVSCPPETDQEIRAAIREVVEAVRGAGFDDGWVDGDVCGADRVHAMYD